MELLFNYSWPGNIRELENLIERMIILKGQGQIDIDDLPSRYKGTKYPTHSDRVDIPSDGMDFNMAVDRYENALILRALEKLVGIGIRLLCY